MRSLQKKVKTISNIIIYWQLKDEMLVHISLLNMEKLMDLVSLCHMMSGFKLNLMRNPPKLPNRDLESMLLVHKNLRGPNSKFVSQIYEVIYVEGHIGV